MWHRHTVEAAQCNVMFAASQLFSRIWTFTKLLSITSIHALLVRAFCRPGRMPAWPDCRVFVVPRSASLTPEERSQVVSNALPKRPSVPPRFRSSRSRPTPPPQRDNFPCPQCSEAFSAIDELQVHMLTSCPLAAVALVGDASLAPAAAAAAAAPGTAATAALPPTATPEPIAAPVSTAGPVTDVPMGPGTQGVTATAESVVAAPPPAVAQGEGKKQQQKKQKKKKKNRGQCNGKRGASGGVSSAEAAQALLQRPVSLRKASAKKAKRKAKKRRQRERKRATPAAQFAGAPTPASDFASASAHASACVSVSVSASSITAASGTPSAVPSATSVPDASPRPCLLCSTMCPSLDELEIHMVTTCPYMEGTGGASGAEDLHVCPLCSQPCFTADALNAHQARACPALV